MVGTAPYAGLVVPDAKAGRAFYLHGSGNNYNLTAVNFTNLQLVGSFVVTNVLGTPTSLVRWGVDGLAFRTTGGQLYVIRTILADDRDSDSLPDSWELQYFTSANSPGAGPTDDPDGDGMNNLMEFQSGWNPVVVDGLRLLSCQLQQNGDCALSVFGQLGQSYWVLASTNLSEWEPIIHFTCTNQPMTVVDSVGLNFRQRYYRIAPSPP